MFTLQARGLISFNHAAFLALAEPVAVALLYDARERIVAMRKVSKSHRNAFMVRKQQQANSFLVGAQGFCSTHGIPTQRSVRFIGRDYGDGRWGFALRDGKPVQNRRGGRAGPPITDRWRATSDGFEVPGLMNITHKAMSHPGYLMRAPGQKPPSVRIGMLVACEPLGETPPTSEIRSRMLGFVTWAPVMELINGITHVQPGVSWTPWGGHGRFSFELALTGESEEEAPVASALFIPPQAGMTRYGRDSRCAEFVLDIEPRDAQGEPASAAALAVWHDRFTRILKLPTLLAQFLGHDLELATSDDPPAQAGVWLNAPRAITELVDTGPLRAIKGSAVSNQFIGWALADPIGNGPADTSLDWLTQMCDFTLRLNDYEPTLSDIGRQHS